MPFTPFHFGIGLAAKGAVPRGFYLLLFVALQVVIDLESLYNLVRGRWPAHTFMHTLPGATLVAVAATATVTGAVVLWSRVRSHGTPGVPSPWRVCACVLGTCVFATWSHVGLDAIMHSDVRPFWPISLANPLLGIVDVQRLDSRCVLIGAAGAPLWVLRLAWQAGRVRTADQSAGRSDAVTWPTPPS